MKWCLLVGGPRSGQYVPDVGPVYQEGVLPLTQELGSLTYRKRPWSDDHYYLEETPSPSTA